MSSDIDQVSGGTLYVSFKTVINSLSARVTFRWVFFLVGLLRNEVWLPIKNIQTVDWFTWSMLATKLFEYVMLLKRNYIPYISYAIYFGRFNRQLQKLSEKLANLYTYQNLVSHVPCDTSLSCKYKLLSKQPEIIHVKNTVI